MKSVKKVGKKKFRTHRHKFMFKIPDPLNTGKVSVISTWAKVINATKTVTLQLKAEDVKKSIAVGGVSNTQTCTMALCARRQAGVFPHPVEGYIDWQYSRAYVVSKLDSRGLPSECVCYWHDDNIAKLNDSKGGQSKLLEDLLVNGDRVVLLRAVRNKSRRLNRPKVETRTKKKIKRGPEKMLPHKGANLRFAFASLGGVPNQKIHSPHSTSALNNF